MTHKSKGNNQVRPFDADDNQLEIVETLQAVPKLLLPPEKAKQSAVSLNPNVVIDVQWQIASLYPWEMVKHFHHAVREGDVQFVRAAIAHKASLLDSLDERLMCAVSYAVKYRRLEVLQLLLRRGANLNLRGQEGTRPIHMAATFDVREAMQLLLQQKGLKIDIADDKGQTALHVACRRSHVEMVRLLLESGADVLKKEKDGVSALHQPSRNGSIELCKLLLSRGAYVNTADNNGLTPVMVACIEGRSIILKELLRQSLEKTGKRSSIESLKTVLERQDNDGSTALHHATQNREIEIINNLLESGANINAKRNDGNTPLHIAASLGYQDVVDVLLSKGADPSAVDKKKRTPLHECGLNNQPDIARKLIAKGSNVNAADDQFMSPLHWACRRGHRPVVDALLEFNARLDGHDVGMRTPLHWAVIEDHEAIVERLLEAPGIELVFNRQDVVDRTALHYAAEKGFASLARRLVASGADCTLTDSDERRPAHAAAKAGHLDCLRVLIEAAARMSVDQRDQDERSAVLLAAEEGRFDVFKFLCVDCGADFSAKDDVGRNSLMLAVAKSHYEIAKFLLDRDLDINATDVNKNTALHYAAKEDSTGRCVRLLLEYAAQLSENNNKETAVDFAILVNNREALEVFFGEQYWSWTMAYRRHGDGRTHMDKLIQHSPEFALRVLDYGIETTLRDPMDKNFAVIYNYSLIDPGPDDPASQPHRYLGLMTMARYKQLDLLKHPLSTAIMQEKWLKFASFALWVDFIFYVLFVACVTLFVVDQGPLPPNQLNEDGCRNTSAGMRPSLNITIGAGAGAGRPMLSNWRIIAEKSIITCFLLIRILLELLKIIHKRLAYFKSIEVYFYLALYICTFFFMYPPDSEPCMWNWMFGLVSIILAWSLVLFQIECIPFTGIYSLMFQKVLISLVKVLLIFCFFIMAFAMAFYSTMKNSTPFSTVPYAILKTFDMTVGELEFVTYFVTANYGPFQTAVQCVFVAFVIIMPIALMNLLIGVAVGDIEGITRDAESQLLAIRINLIYEVETNSPRYFQRRFHRSHREVYPNRTYTGLRALFRGSYEDDYRAYKTAQRAEQSVDKLEIDSNRIGEAIQMQNDRMTELECSVKDLSAKLDAFLSRSGR